MNQRLSTQLLTPNQGIATGVQQAVINPAYTGAVGGHGPNYEEYLGMKQLVRSRLRAVELTYPRGFDLLPDPVGMRNMLRGLMERNYLSIDGLNKTLEVDIVDTPAGHAGELWEDPSFVKRARTQVQYRFNEKEGRPVSRFFEYYITQLIGDPATQVPAAAQLGSRAQDWLPDMYSFAMMFFDTDASGMHVKDAWIVANMFPHSSGTIDGKTEVGQAGDKHDHDIQFGGIAQVGPGVDALAQSVLNGFSLNGANAFNRTPFIASIDPSILAAPSGLSNQIETLVQNQYRG